MSDVDDVCQDVRAHVDSVTSAYVGELEERLSKTLSGCGKKTCVRDESDALKVLLAGVETQFREDHAALVDAINAHTVAMNTQTALLEELCGEVKVVSEKMDDFCSHTGRLRHIEGDVASIARSGQGIANGTDTVSSIVTSLNERLDDTRLVVGHSINEVRKAEEEQRLAELKVQFENRKTEEAIRSSFSVTELEIYR